jgi:glycerol kinase
VTLPRAILAIDQGTTGSTGLVLNEQAQVIGRGYSEFPQHYPQPGWVEHDADEIWEVTHQVARDAIAAAGDAEIVGIGITNQRETVVMWDRKTGVPVGRAIVWQDRRTADICRSLKAAGKEEWVRERTGLVLDPYFSGTKLTWMLQNDPSLRARAEAGELAAGTIDCWLIWKLTGGRVHATDPTNASRTLLYNINTHAWDPELCELLAVPQQLLPNVMPSSGVFGETDEKLFGRSIPVAGVAGDQQAALFGQACVHAGQAKNTYGTGAFLLLNTGEERVASKHGLLTTVACGPKGEACYALEGSIFIAGAAIQWLRDELKIIGNAAESAELAGSVKDNGGVYLVPAFVGLGAPHWDPEARGTLVGLTRGSTRAHVVRAALESMAYSTHDVLQAMISDSGVAANELSVDGGASQNDWLMQFQADVLDLPVVRPKMVECTAAGAAGLAGIGVGVWTDAEEYAAVREEPVRFDPSMSAGERERLVDGWKRAVHATIQWARATHSTL